MYPIFYSILLFTLISLNQFQVPGRLGLLITLYLITSNTYASIQGPMNRGFSYIEIWMSGVQITLLLAIVEYGVILAIKKYHRPQNSRKIVQVTAGTSVNSANMNPNEPVNNWDIDEMCKKMDIFTFFCSLTFIIIFNFVYWIIL